MSEPTTQADIDHWYYGERIICGHPDHKAPDFKCVKNAWHFGDEHDPFYEATPEERAAAYRGVHPDREDPTS